MSPAYEFLNDLLIFGQKDGANDTFQYHALIFVIDSRRPETVKCVRDVLEKIRKYEGENKNVNGLYP